MFGLLRELSQNQRTSLRELASEFKKVQLEPERAAAPKGTSEFAAVSWEVQTHA
jgi:hypothetical protein